MEARAARVAQASAVRLRPPVRSHATPGRFAACAPWRGCRLPRPAWPHPVESDWRNRWYPWELRRDPADERILFIQHPEPHRFAEPLRPAPRLRQQLLDLCRRTGQEGLGKPNPFALQFAHDIERFVAFLRLESIDAQDHGIHVGIRGRELIGIVLASGQHLLVAMDVALDRIVRQANLVRIG